jgi:hypothetical protein
VRTIEEDLEKLSPDDLRRVCRWAEDRLVNAVTPLAVQLQMDARVESRGDHTLAAARWAVFRILEAVDEVRRISTDGGSAATSFVHPQTAGSASRQLGSTAAGLSLLSTDDSLSC